MSENTTIKRAAHVDEINTNLGEECPSTPQQTGPAGRLSPLNAFSPLFGAGDELSSVLQNAQVEAFECPLCATFSVPNDTPERGRVILEHLKEVHKTPEREVPVNAAGVGIVQVEATVWMKPAAVRRSAVLLKYRGATFVWTLESRLRADAETQASVTVQLVEDSTHSDNHSPFPTPLLSSSPGHSRASSPHSGSSSRRESLDSERTIICPNAPYHISVRVPKAAASSESKLIWETDCGAYHSSHRHERLISHGDGLVALFPTHQEIFSPSSDGGKTRLVNIVTTIQAIESK